MNDKENNRYLNIFLNGKLFAIYLDSISQIIQMQKITKIPNSEDYLKGIISLRGQIVPVMDLKKLIFDKYVEIEKRTNIVIIDFGEESVGFMIDKLDKVGEYDDKQIFEMSSLSKKSSYDRYASSVIKLEDETRPIIDFKKIYSNLEKNKDRSF